MNDEIKDMALEDTEEEKAKEKIEAEKAVADMSLDEPQVPSATEIGARLAKALPDIDLIDTGTLKIVKMMDSSYKVNDMPLANLKPEDLTKIDNFLKSKGE